MKLKDLLITTFATLVLIPAVGNTAYASIQSSSWHYGILPWMKGYWHTKDGYTFKIWSTHIWNRISGWNKMGEHKFRFPYHGYDKVKYQGPASESMDFKCFNPQTEKWQWITFLKGSSRRVIYISDLIDGEYGKYYPLYRGNK